jgi:hypothetical protein
VSSGASLGDVSFLTWDPDGPEFWLTEDYFPGIRERDRKAFPVLSELAGVYGKLSSVESGIERLRHDWSGEWVRRYGKLLQRDAVDLGYRLITADL